MVTCPSCGASVNADFGMVACTACDCVFMVEIDGTVTLPTEQDGEGSSEESSHQYAELSEELVSSDSSDESTQYEVAPFDANEESHDNSSNNEYSSLNDDTSYGADSTLSEDASQSEELLAENQTNEPEGTEYSEDFLDSMDEEQRESIEDDPKDPLGVTRFDGTEASQLVDGPYYYDLRVSGIDTASIKQQVMEMLSDKRLNWSPEEIKKKIKMGQLVLENINPVRAVLVILKLQSLDVDIEWDQRAYTEDKKNSGDKDV